jgi:hypothetical protein
MCPLLILGMTCNMLSAGKEQGLAFVLLRRFPVA